MSASSSVHGPATGSMNSANKDYDPEKASLEPERSGAGVVDPGTFNGVHGAVAPGESIWSKFNYWNTKLEKKLGIESVSLSSDHGIRALL